MPAPPVLFHSWYKFLHSCTSSVAKHLKPSGDTGSHANNPGPVFAGGALTKKQVALELHRVSSLGGTMPQSWLPGRRSLHVKNISDRRDGCVRIAYDVSWQIDATHSQIRQVREVALGVWHRAGKRITEQIAAR